MGLLPKAYFKRTGCICGMLIKTVPNTQFSRIENSGKGNGKRIFDFIRKMLFALKYKKDYLERLSEQLRHDLQRKYLPDVYKEIIDCNFDVASVRTGSKYHLQIRMKELECGLICTHSTAHQVELALLDSMKFNNYLVFDTKINNIFKFYHYSPTC